MSSKWNQELEEQRNKRRKEVLEAARRLFLEKDFPKVTMSDIAREAGTSKVTLYKYYKSIDEIAFEVQKRLVLEMREFFGEFSVDTPAYQQILDFLKCWLDFLKTKEDILRFQALFDHYYRTQYPEIKQVHMVQDVFKQVGGPFYLLLERGQNEGSIRTDINAHELTAWSASALMSMAHRLASRRDILEKESHLPIERIMEMTIESIIIYIRAN